MTLKQFFQLAAGAGIALLIYATPLPAIFKWPLIVFFVIAGAAFAFLPFQDRPLEEWLKAFFRAIYGPTLFSWEMRTNKPKYFSDETAATVANQVASDPVSATPGTPAVSAPQDAPTATLDAKEDTFISKITGLFSGNHEGHTSPPVTPSDSLQTGVAIPQNNPIQTANPVTQSNVLFTQGHVSQDIAKSPLPTLDTKVPFVITPKTEVVTMPKRETPVIDPGVSVTSSSFTTENTQQVFAGQERQGVQSAVFSLDAAPPTPASIPNVIVGQVMSFEGKIIEGAIMEITDQQGRPVRALKTNRAGHFMTVTALPNGVYTIHTEKEGFTFSPVSFEAKGEIIQAIAIKATPVATQQQTNTQPNGSN